MLLLSNEWYTDGVVACFCAVFICLCFGRLILQGSNILQAFVNQIKNIKPNLKITTLNLHVKMIIF